MIATIRAWARKLKQETLVIYFAGRDPRTPWFVRLLALAVAAYALSPIDLIPDFIPVLGYLDDLVIVPLGLVLVLRLLPEEVKQAARVQAAVAAERPVNRAMVPIIVAIWLVLLGFLGLWLWRFFRS